MQFPGVYFFSTIEKKCREIHVIFMYSSLKIISFTIFAGRNPAKVVSCLKVGKRKRQHELYSCLTLYNKPLS